MSKKSKLFTALRHINDSLNAGKRPNPDDMKSVALYDLRTLDSDERECAESLFYEAVHTFGEITSTDEMLDIPFYSGFEFAGYSFMDECESETVSRNGKLCYEVFGRNSRTCRF